MRFILPLLFLLLPALAARAQQTFIKTVADSTFGSVVRILPAPDNGWIIFSPDSLKLCKFSSCGRSEWSRQYKVAGTSYVPGLSDIISTADGGYVFFTRLQEGQVLVPLVVRLDAAGNVRWSRSFEDNFYRHFPYTISQDQDGNFVLYGNVEHVNNTPFYNMICRINAQGDLLRTQFYDHGGTWGGAIVTSDKGLLARTGHTFFKTDAAGDVQWTCSLSAPGGYYYFAPVEVADGYIFTSQNPDGSINFHKIDKQGNMLWGGRRRTDLSGRPPYLRKMASGHFAGVFTRLAGSKSYLSVAEFDQDLRIISKSTLNYAQPDLFLQVHDICLSKSGAPLLAGRALAGPDAVPFFARADRQFRVSCDTLLPQVTQVSETADLVFASTHMLPYTLAAKNRSVTVRSFQVTEQAICAAPLALALGPDTIACSGTGLALKNRTPDLFERYEWSTGETTAQIAVQQAGTYWLRATYSCGLETVTDTIIVTFPEFPEPSLLPEATLCSNETIELDAAVPGGAYKWQDGSTGSRLRVTRPGEYYVDIEKQGCTRRFHTRVSERESLLMPNVFTPNGDQANDAFRPLEICGIAAATLTIYNRWGRLLYRSSTLSDLSWDGSSGAGMQPAGMYFWMLDYRTNNMMQKVKKGYVELLGR